MRCKRLPDPERQHPWPFLALSLQRGSPVSRSRFGMSIAVSGIGALDHQHLARACQSVSLTSSLRGLERRQRAFQPAHVWLMRPSAWRRAPLWPTPSGPERTGHPAVSRQVPHMVADSEIQRIARLTPLADVLAQLRPVDRAGRAARGSGRAALGLTLAADIVIAGRANRRRALALRDGMRCAPTRRSMPAPMRPAPLSPRAGTASTSARRCRPAPTRSPTLDAVQTRGASRGAGRGRAGRRRAGRRTPMRPPALAAALRRAAAADRRGAAAGARHRTGAGAAAARARGVRQQGRDRRRRPRS